MNKRSLRARMREARLAFASVEPIRVAPEFIKRLRAGSVVASYRPMPGEADPAPLERAARQAGCALALPFLTDRSAPMRFRRWDGALAAGPYGIEQPPADAPEVAPDVILTPLVAFDRTGARLGQGAGLYDRAFAAHPGAWRVGVAWSVQEVDVLPIDAWDVPLHAIATEKEWITP
ncbi:5-formyltetrahydrofolate cyclo-ligase [Sphingomonas lenta]|uniref:5-formyltetrahydrofolate cyclo-ligase n=1 Tax=Sphingomonas lenta TaxID=1141887 RepID=UPI002481F188|nr:5-formyltetrahydrofolate cyclo-ligase [Sphingomonas lenta]